MLVWLEEPGSDLMHRGHGAARSHVDPEGGKESKDAALEVLWVHHDVHLILRVARIDGISKTTIVVVPLHLEGATGVVLSMLIGRPGLGGPAVRVEVTVGRAIERWELGIFTTVMVSDLLESLSKVFVMIRLSSVCLEDDMGEQSCKLTLADFRLSKTKTGIVFATEFGEQASSNQERLISVHPIVNREKMFVVLFTKHFHDHSNVFFVFVCHAGSALELGRLDSSLSLRVEAIRDSVLDTDALILVKPVVVCPDSIIVGTRNNGDRCGSNCSLH